MGMTDPSEEDIDQSPSALVPPTFALSEPLILVLAEGETQGAVSNARGHLFERFVARLLQSYGYEEPTQEQLNVSADGIELDIRATHRLTGQPAIAECKAYSKPVTAGMLGTFHSKLVTSRYSKPATHGFFVALPRLTSQGMEQARLISSHDSGFTLLTTTGVVKALRDLKTITECPTTNILTSNPAVLVTEYGVYTSCQQLDATSRSPERLLVWGKSDPVPQPVLELLSASPYMQGLAVVDAGAGNSLRQVGSGKETTQRAAASKLIVYLEDRRVLTMPRTNRYSQAPQCVASVLQIRETLTRILMEPDTGDELAVNLKAMRAACRRFLDTVGGGNHSRPHVDARSGTLAAALEELRAAFGIQLGVIAARYKLDLPADLAGILPDPASIEDLS
ncbi:restriction endonuclease [Streptomyces cynarae]|uniref:restriction endonuclease n=1 Tax=Streptomyces cynarae TaxID=2981134 RepID=UPI00406C6D25